jgi:hypothetical protein
MKPKLKPPGTKRLKQQKCDILLSNYAFSFDLRRYTTGLAARFAQAWLRTEYWTLVLWFLDFVQGAPAEKGVVTKQGCPGKCKYYA